MVFIQSTKAYRSISTISKTGATNVHHSHKGHGASIEDNTYLVKVHDQKKDALER